MRRLSGTLVDSIREVVTGLPMNADAVSRALVRERAKEARHIAERIRARAGHVSAFASMADQLDERGRLLDEVAEKMVVTRGTPE